MRRSVAIASIHHDPSVTVEMLESFSRVPPAELLIFSMFTESEMPEPIGKCWRLWREGLELWADIEVGNPAHWPTVIQDPMVHAEGVVTYKGLVPRLVAVIITSMPRGMLAESLAQGFEVFKKRAEN